MIFGKRGAAVSGKKKSVEEMKKLNEKKKIMMKEESEEEEEEDTSDEGEEESEIDADELDSDEGSEEDYDDNDDDGDEEEDDDDDDDESEEDLAATSKKQRKGQTPEKSANKTPSKQSLQASFQKSEAQSNKKTPNKKKGLVENDSSMITPFKKTAKADNSSAKTPSSSKQQKDTGSFKGTIEKRKREGGEEEGALKKPRTDAPDPAMYSEQQRQRDRRCLFVRQFPKDTTEEELKALSPDIVVARFPGRRKGKKFAFLEFASEKKAEENFQILEKVKIKGEKMYVDFVGEKSKNFQLRNKQPRHENKKRIFVSGLPSTVTMEDIGKHFPQAISIFMRKSGSNRIAHIEFETEDAGEEALKRNCSLTIKGQPVTVMYAIVNKSIKKKLFKNKHAKEVGQQKRVAKSNQKIQKKKEEEDDDDDDDDDDDEDEDESDEDESDEE